MESAAVMGWRCCEELPSAEPPCWVNSARAAAAADVRSWASAKRISAKYYWKISFHLSAAGFVLQLLQKLRVNSIFKIFALYSIRSDANKQTRPETFLFFKYIILVQSYRYIHRIINNIYKNIKHNIYDYKIKRELFTLNICTKLWTIAGGVTGGLNIKVGPHMLSRVTSTRRQPVDQKKNQTGRLFSQLGERQTFCCLAPFKCLLKLNWADMQCANLQTSFTKKGTFPITYVGSKDTPKKINILSPPGSSPLQQAEMRSL